MDPPSSRKHKILKISIAVLLVSINVRSKQIAMVVIFFVQMNEILDLINSFEDWISERPFWGMLLIMICFILAILLMVPTGLFIFTIGLQCHNLMGLALGFFIGTLLVFICTVAGATLAFLFSRKLLKDYLLSSIKPNWYKTRAILQALEHNGFRLVLMFRLAPIFPFSLLNYALGATNLTTKAYVLGSIGLLPKQALYVYIAVSVGSLKEAISKEASDTTQLIVIASIGTFLGIVAAVYLTIVARREFKKIVEEAQPILGEVEEERIDSDASLNN
jgi:uncharacterized membrane protein YdjX (TVP38/TMEM64 family)